MNPIKSLKLTILNVMIRWLNRHRIGINNFYGTSREISLLYESASQDPPSQKLLEILANIYAEYSNFCSHYSAPRLVNSSSEQNQWANAPLMLQGEHYALLPMIANLCTAKIICEIGTFQGASAKSLVLNSTATHINTFDIIDWRKISPSFLSDNDFADGRLCQIIADLSIPKCFNANKELLLDADLIFLDGPKDYCFEKEFLGLLFHLYKANPENKAVLIIDDINVSTMKLIWKSIPHPKAAIDCIGHWSGTGIVLINS